MANEYINRDAVIELLVEKQRAICPYGRLGRGYVCGSDRDKYDEIEADIDTVQDIPAADVVERERGRWKGAGFGDYYCSLCNSTYSIGAERLGLFKFCPNCGADMRGAGNDRTE